MCTAPERDFLSVLHCGFFVEIRHCRGRNSAFYVISSCILEEIFAEYATLRECCQVFLRKYYKTMNSINQYKATLFGNFHQKANRF